MKTHLNFETSDLAKSVEFYSALLNSSPVKLYNDYALFITDDPGMELALDASSAVRSSESTHYGIAVDSIEAVDELPSDFRLPGSQRMFNEMTSVAMRNRPKCGLPIHTVAVGKYIRFSRKRPIGPMQQQIVAKSLPLPAAFNLNPIIA